MHVGSMEKALPLSVEHNLDKISLRTPVFSGDFMITILLNLSTGSLIAKQLKYLPETAVISRSCILMWESCDVLFSFTNAYS